jgi:GT2 family glycosyltransferase
MKTIRGVMNSKGSIPFVYVVILAWNGRDDTLESLHSLESVWNEKTKGVLVDNGSTDGTAEAVREQYPVLEILQTGENLGFTGGNNVGIRHALKMGADYIILLNNDTVVDPDFVRELLTVAISADIIGFVSPKIYFFDPPDLLWFAGARFSTRTGYGRMIGYREKDCGQYDEVREIDRPCGCAMLVSRRLCEEVGLMYPGIFLYMDEVEWMLRARKSGFKAYYAPKAKVWHKISASVGKESHPEAFYYGVRNTLFVLNNHDAYSLFIMNWFRNAVVLVVFVTSLIFSSSGLMEGIRSISHGVIDYYRSRFGKRIDVT